MDLALLAPGRGGGCGRAKGEPLVAGGVDGRADRVGGAVKAVRANGTFYLSTTPRRDDGW